MIANPDIAIVGYGETPVSRAKTERNELLLTMEEYLAWSADLALSSASLGKEDIDRQGVVINGSQHPHSEIWATEVLQNMGITPRYLARVDNGGASGITMLARATEALRLGLVDVVLCLSADAPQSGKYITKIPHLYFGEPYIHSRDFEDPYGMQGPKAIFAFIMRRHMHLYGTTLEQIGKIAVVQRSHALLNPNAYFKQSITLDDYLSSPILADPIRLLDNVMLVDGGLSFVVTNSERAKKMTDKPVYLLGLGLSFNYYHGSRISPDVTVTGITVAAREAMKMADIELKDIDLIEPYDDFPIAVLMQIEDMGFCKKGEGGKFVEMTDLGIKGELPLNTGGGQLSAGQPGLAGGLVNLVETIRQLKNEGGKRQVSQAKIGITTGIGGLSYCKNVQNACVAILGSSSMW